MKIYPTLEETLAKRFDDMSEVIDIIHHGADTGVSDFTYTYDINSFWNEFESEIEDHYYDIYGNTWMTDLTEGLTSFNELRARLVWGVVEEFCIRKNDLMEAVA